MEKEVKIDFYLDLIEELKDFPVTCEYDKRRKCDSYYIKLNSELTKKNIKLEEEIKSLKMLLSAYQDVLKEVVDKTTGKVVK